jgi:hypothetical protein
MESQTSVVGKKINSFITLNINGQLNLNTITGYRDNPLPIDAARTMPRPMARGPPMYRNFSLGAHTASIERPATGRKTQK